MPDIPFIQSIQNPWVAHTRKLQSRHNREQLKLFLVEGTHLVQEALATRWPLETVCFTTKWRDSHPEELRVLRNGSSSKNIPLRLVEVADAVMDRIATTTTPDGVIAIAHIRSAPKAEPSSFLARSGFAIALERLQSPDNLGAIVRSSIASGCSGVWLGENSVDVTHPKSLRASAGQWFRQPPQQVNLDEWLSACQNNHVNVLAAAANGRSFWELDLTGPTVFVLGNEGSGLSDETMNRCDGIISIPMTTGVESLNVAMTATLLMYEAKRQRDRKPANDG